MHDDPDILPPASEDPETHARDAVEAMRARGTDRLDVERALIRGARQHARFLERHGLSDTDAKPEVI